jgi:hypothetical protein
MKRLMGLYTRFKERGKYRSLIGSNGQKVSIKINSEQPIGGAQVFVSRLHVVDKDQQSRILYKKHFFRNNFFAKEEYNKLLILKKLGFSVVPEFYRKRFQPNLFIGEHELFTFDLTEGGKCFVWTYDVAEIGSEQYKSFFVDNLKEEGINVKNADEVMLQIKKEFDLAKTMGINIWPEAWFIQVDRRTSMAKPFIVDTGGITINPKKLKLMLKYARHL